MPVKKNSTYGFFNHSNVSRKRLSNGEIIIAHDPENPEIALSLTFIPNPGKESLTTIAATFTNMSDSFSIHWIVRDKVADIEIINQKFRPNESVQKSLQADGHWGEAQYKKKGSSSWTNRSFIEDGEDIQMY